ncbi:MAG: amidohydrolase family protein [Candidatus Helarchaeota archaeon]
MIIVEMLNEKTNEIRRTNVLLIDSHSHLGSDEDGVKNMNPLAPGGTFDFYARLTTKMKEKMGGEHAVEAISNNQKFIYNFRISPQPNIFELYRKTSELNKSSQNAELFMKSQNSWIIDQGVVFPFQDIFRFNKSEAAYRASNINISRNTTRFPLSCRLIGYGRCDPQEKQKAVNEVKFAIEQLGLRGLKLHPRSEQWLDHIKESYVIDVLMECVKHSIPVVFDTRGRKSILDIKELIDLIRNTITKKDPKLLPHLKVQIAHAPAGNVGDEEVYAAIADPNSVGDVSMLHGDACLKFYLGFKKWYEETHKNGKKWSEHLVFGSDYPYFFEKHASDNIFALISQKFFDNGGTLDDFQNIVGLNLLKWLPEYGYPLQQTTSTKNLGMYLYSNEMTNVLEIEGEVLAALSEFQVININKLFFVMNKDWRILNNEIMLEVSPLSNPTQKILMTSINIIDGVKYLKILQKEDKFKPFGGYKLFNLEDKKFLLNNQPFDSTDNPAQAFNVLKNAF